MKKSHGLTLIIVWSCVLALVVALFVALATGNGFRWNVGFHFPGDRSSFVTVKEETIDADGIDELSLNWISGQLRVTVGGDAIHVVQKANKDLSEKDLVRLENRNGKLTVKDGRGGFHLFSFGTNSTDLEVTIPEKTFRAMDISTTSADVTAPELRVQTLKVSTTSGEITLSGTAGAVNISTTSGDMQLDGLLAEEKLDLSTTSGEVRGEGAASVGLKASSVSGDIRLSGTFSGDVNLGSTSGEIYLDTSEAPSSLQSKSVSGDISLRIPENSGFTMEYHSVSGRFSSDFAATDNGSASRYGDGSRSYRANTTSGSIRMQKQ